MAEREGFEPALFICNPLYLWGLLPENRVSKTSVREEIAQMNRAVKVKINQEPSRDFWEREER